MTGAGCEVMRSATFAVSIAEPPPTETNPSTPRVARDVGGVLQGVERRLDAGAVVDDDLDALGLDRRAHAIGVAGRGDAGIGDEQRARDAEALELPARVGDGARAELDRRRLEGEDRLALHARHASFRRVTDPLVRALADAVGERHVLTDDDVRAPYERDWTGRYGGAARAVVRPGGHRGGRGRRARLRARTARRSSRRAATPAWSAAACRATARCC